MILSASSCYFIVLLIIITTTKIKASGECYILVQLKKELTGYTFITVPSSKLSSWTPSKDCCQWRGVKCDEKGRVIHLDLSNEVLFSDVQIIDTSSLFSLEFLQKLNLRNTRFYGPLSNSFGKLTKLSRIELASCNFNGNIPASMANLTKLVYIDLSNNSFSGTISSSLFSIPFLQELNLSYNQFGNSIAEFSNPPSPASSTLTSLDLSHNDLQGHIPKSLFQFQNLNILFLSYNNFTGPLKLEEIAWKFRNLAVLGLSFNNLVIDANYSGYGFHLLSGLELASSGIKELPDIRNKSTIQILDLSNNQISGEIPNWIWKIGSLGVLNLSSNLFVGMQKPYAIPSNILFLDLHSNMLTGELPTIPKSIMYLDFSNNNLESSLPDKIGNNLTSAYFLSLSNNRLHGVIPRSICKSLYIRVVDLSNNKFNGSIPTCLMEKSSSHLLLLNLGNNMLTGSLIGKFTKSCELRTLDFNGNILEGKVPRSLANCKYLEILNLSNNQMSDSFPCFLKNISDLRVLILRGNRFYGDIHCGGDMGYYGNKTWEKLQIIDFGLNQFIGTIPPRLLGNLKGMMADVEYNNLHIEMGAFMYYQDRVTIINKGVQMELVKILTTFTCIDFSGNQFNGEIPFGIGDLKSLYVLNLSYNDFTGPIPPVIGNLTQLGSLDLSSNQLSGNIPFQLLDLTFLSVLNLSYNQLTGTIPSGKQFATFTETSFLGNPLLRRQPVLNDFNVSSNPKTLYSERVMCPYVWLFVSLMIGVFVGSVISCFTDFPFGRRSEEETVM